MARHTSTTLSTQLTPSRLMMMIKKIPSTKRRSLHPRATLFRSTTSHLQTFAPLSGRRRSSSSLSPSSSRSRLLRVHTFSLPVSSQAGSLSIWLVVSRFFRVNLPENACLATDLVFLCRVLLHHPPHMGEPRCASAHHPGFIEYGQEIDSIQDYIQDRCEIVRVLKDSVSFILEWYVESKR